ncbi:MAG: SDR family NAD(P)-dependent oxidoreductase, partial [Desulfomonilia bacterium]|nr:SDR family NAD(P)-dependent oxidoreductase [Desulfomonilia bacterium]
MYPDLKDKTALITGAGKRSGIGYAIAEKLASCGTNVVIADLGTIGCENSQVSTGTWDEMCSIAKELTERYQVKTLTVNLDVTSVPSIADMVQEIRSSYNRIDILCNNAGASFGVPNAAHTYEEGEWMRTLDVNLHGVFRVTRAILPFMMSGNKSII